MLRSSLLALLIACDTTDPIERVSVESSCGIVDRDAMEATVDGRRLCARARMYSNPVRPDGTEAIIPPGTFDLSVTARMIGADANQYYLVVGFANRLERFDDEARTAWIGPMRVRGSEKLRDWGEDGALAALWITQPLEDLQVPNRDRLWLWARTGSVTFDHYDVGDGTSRGSFDLQFASTSADDKRTIRVAGTFQTATPITDDD